jgi:hypothetical protein
MAHQIIITQRFLCFEQQRGIFLAHFCVQFVAFGSS